MSAVRRDRQRARTLAALVDAVHRHGVAPVSSRHAARGVVVGAMAWRDTTRCVGIAHDDAVAGHHGPPNHPEQPDRTVAIVRLLRACGVYPMLFRVPSGVPVSHASVKAVHAPGLVKTVKSLSSAASGVPGFYVAADTYSTNATPYAAALSAGAVVECVRAVAGPHAKCQSAFAVVRPPGHHACVAKAGGFCFYNNVAIAARVAQQELGIPRVAIVDWDVHHGNGTQNVFLQDPSVLFISLHRYDNGAFYPCTGAPTQVGRNKEGASGAAGTCVNVGWNSAGVGDNAYRVAFEVIVLPILRAFNPGLVLVSAGFDAVRGDPLGKMLVTPAMFGWMTKRVCEVGTGRVVLALEGGYNVRAIAECGAACVDALLDAAGVSGRPAEWPTATYDQESARRVVDRTLDEAISALTPSEADTIRLTLRTHKPFWPALALLPVDAGSAAAVAHLAATPPPSLSAPRQCVMELTSGDVLHGLKADTPCPVASLGKVITAVVALRACASGVVALEDIVTVPARAVGIKGTSAGLAAGESLTLHHLLHGLMLPSGNDAANAIAYHVGSRLSPPPCSDEEWTPYGSGPSYDGEWSRTDSMTRFVYHMNKFAADVGATNTVLRNPHGLTHPQQHSTAKDVATMFRAAWQMPEFRSLAACRSFIATVTSAKQSKPRRARWTNTNRSLGQRIGADNVVLGGKTGVTMGKGGAGGCLAVAVGQAQDDEKAFVVVTLGSRNKALRFADNHRLAVWWAGSPKS